MHNTYWLYYENGGSGTCKRQGQFRHIHIGESDDQLELKKGGVKDTSKGMSLWRWTILLT